MSIVNFLSNVAKGAMTGVVVVTALPFLGTVGTITKTGKAISSVVGAAAGAYDYSKKK